MLIVDTGVLLAVADADDPDHARCEALLTTYPPEALLLPTPVMVETSWLIEDRLGAPVEAAFLQSVNAGELTRTDLSADDWERVAQLVETYADLGLGLVDASIVALAERLGVDTTATLNRRDFVVVRPRHIDAFVLVP